MRGEILARQAHIVSFEDARVASGSRRAKSAESARETRRADTVKTASTNRSSRSGKAEAKADRHQTKQKSKSSSSTAAAMRGKTDRSSSDVKREQRRRSRTKARAEKMFDRQYAAESSTGSQAAETTPRAALYEGRASSSQRKSARMQRASQAGPVSAKINPAGWFANLSVSPRSLKVATAVLCLVLVGLFLYTPAQQYYQSLREHDKLEAEYAVLAQRNEVLDEQNDSLASNAGLEDAARQKYGYVVKGDQTAVVTGLSETATDSSRDGENIEANVLTSSVRAPEEWYTPYLDAFFGVSQ